MLGAGSDFSWKELWNEMQLGMLMGWMLGAVIATLTVFAPIYAIVGGILIAFETLMVVVAGIGVVISLKEGKIAQALFRALLLFFAYKGLKKSIDKYGAKAWESLKSLGKKLGDHIIELHNDNRGSVDLDALFGKKTSYGKSSSNLEKTKGWKVGDPIDNLTKAGNEPSWNTVKKRYWKNEAYYNGELYSERNLEFMKKGNAPHYSEAIDVPMELHHIEGRKIPNPHNESNLLAVWPWEHDAIDPYRFYTGPRP